MVFGEAGLAGAVSTTPVDEERVVHEGDYTWVLLYSGGYPVDMAIDVSWNSSVPIDVWLMDRTQWNRFDSGQTFGYDVAQSGVQGSIRFTAGGARLANGSMYVVLDNTARGNTTPPGSAADDVANVTVTGKFWRPEPEYAPDQGGVFLLRAIEVAFVLVPVLFVVYYVVRKLRKKDRHEVLREELDAGNVVGDGAPKRPEAVVAERWGGAVPQAPWTQAGSGAIPAKACRSCGAAIASGKAFCTQCGTRL